MYEWSCKRVFFQLLLRVFVSITCSLGHWAITFIHFISWHFYVICCTHQQMEEYYFLKRGKKWQQRWSLSMMFTWIIQKKTKRRKKWRWTKNNGNFRPQRWLVLSLFFFFRIFWGNLFIISYFSLLFDRYDKRWSIVY